MKVTEKISADSNPAVLGTALVAGLGVILAVLALGLGVVQGDTGFTGMMLAAGGLLFVLGLAGWIGVAQPHKRFDDISQPAPSDHHHDAHSDEHAIEAAADHSPEVAHH
ncbi:MAG: hypothetical protein HXY41_01705 [Chloroflexi bacterium]|nr:hypothetical protein [Chloroflexota bacterium]